MRKKKRINGKKAKWEVRIKRLSPDFPSFLLFSAALLPHFLLDLSPVSTVVYLPTATEEEFLPRMKTIVLIKQVPVVSAMKLDPETKSSRS